MVEAVQKPPFVVHGDMGQMFQWLTGDVPHPREAIIEGSAGTGKTRTGCEWVVTACNSYPKSKGLIIRKTRVSLNDSVLPILEEEVLGLDHLAVLGGPSRAHRTGYAHPRLGGEIVLGGMDNPTKLFSTQYDWCWVNECQELTKNEWESLHRALRRDGMPGFGNILFGDCNPEDEFHWANRRMESGRCKRILTRFWNNPTLYNHETGEWTPKGFEYTARLRENLTGVTYQRLYLGKWVSASGQVWENYDTAVHKIQGEVEESGGRHFLHVDGWHGAPGRKPTNDTDPCDPIEIKSFLGGQDVGFTAPGNAGVLALDAEGRAYQVAEVHWTKKDHEWWGDVWSEMYERFPVRAIICDHDRALIEHLNRRLKHAGPDGLPGLAREADKRRGKGGEMAGIDEVRVRLNPRDDDSRGFYILENSLYRGRDPELVRDEKPTCLAEEIPAYVYPAVEDGKPIKDSPDPGCSDHGCDRVRYQFRYLKDRTFSSRTKVPYFTDEVNVTLGMNKIFRGLGIPHPGRPQR